MISFTDLWAKRLNLSPQLPPPAMKKLIFRYCIQPDNLRRTGSPLVQIRRVGKVGCCLSRTTAKRPVHFGNQMTYGSEEALILMVGTWKGLRSNYVILSEPRGVESIRRSLGVAARNRRAGASPQPAVPRSPDRPILPESIQSCCVG